MVTAILNQMIFLKQFLDHSALDLFQAFLSIH